MRRDNEVTTPNRFVQIVDRDLYSRDKFEELAEPYLLNKAPVTSAQNFLQASSGSESESGNGDRAGGATTAIAKPKVQSKPKTRTPPMYKVLLLNDDFTPMDFVIHILQKFFAKEYDEATRIMLQVHHQGAGVAGVFSFEIAETKVYQVNQYAKQRNQPLKCTMEKS
jgi:ATP-dependent Clp protease adaptor protein ClpS